MRRPQLTGRAAILAVVVCAIVMSLAYPVREYIAQRRQIAELEEQQAKALEDLRRLEERNRMLTDPAYVRRQARARLHYCGVGEKCYVVRDTTRDADRPAAAAATPAAKDPWYQALWESVEAADKGTGRRADQSGRSE
ncbi:septum formation initiator family protein [Thermopolyspora sp. NPDC052614]|uniref:FtsB family cell division protein n=1 Tax=Thermopolyspora sp. NPDC052614 TaxID=3155682 RepID=UPI0034329332